MKPKILILTDWYLPGTNAGGPVRSIANMIAHLKNEFLFKIITRDIEPIKIESFWESNILSEMVPAPTINGSAISEARSSRLSFIIIKAFCPFTIKK